MYLLVTACIFGLSHPARAQAATATWQAPVDAPTLADAQALKWNLYLTPRNGAPGSAIPVTGAVCSGTVAPFTCSAPLPDKAKPASYDAQVTITAVTPLGQESAPSVPFISPISAPTALQVGR